MFRFLVRQTWSSAQYCAIIAASFALVQALTSCNDDRLKEAAEAQARLERELEDVRSELSATTKRVATLEQLITALRTAAAGPPPSVEVSLDCPPDWERVPNAPSQTLWACRTATPTPTGFWPNCNVTASPAQENQTVRDYVRTALEAAPELRDARRLDARDLTVAGLPAHEAQYEHTLGGRPTRVLATVVIKSAQAFAITCSVTPDLFGNFEQTFHQITNSFHFVR